MPEYLLAAFRNKRLNEVITPGSHDAGIYGEGKPNVNTREFDIKSLARHGVRRVHLLSAVPKDPSGHWAVYGQRAFCLDRRHGREIARCFAPV